MLPLTQCKPKPLDHQFEDDLGELVDRYLLDGVDIEKLKNILRYEATNDHVERRTALLSQEGR